MRHHCDCGADVNQGELHEVTCRLVEDAYLERYGRMSDLEAERFTTVPVRAKPRKRFPPLTRLDAARNGLTLVKALDDYEAGNRGAA